ncbi:MAG: RadC family protein [Flavobacteriaceae bacterium]
MPRNLPIKSWAAEDRPREKLIRQGKQTLTDAELLAILLRTGNRNESALGLAKRILSSTNGKLSTLAQLSLEELCDFKGMGYAKAIGVLAALELGKRQKTQIHATQKLSSSKAVYSLIEPRLGTLPHEEFWIIYLNQSQRLLACEQISRGGISQTTVDVRIALKRALTLQAVAMILAHNHPSGNPQPSTSDKELTTKFVLASQSLDIHVLDHIIVAENTYFSFADQGLL